LAGFDVELLGSNDEPKTQAYAEASEALESLGFKKDKVSKALSTCSGSDTASLVKEALKLLQTL
jgi:Holliday junction DNA helicase RuvA